MTNKRKLKRFKKSVNGRRNKRLHMKKWYKDNRDWLRSLPNPFKNAMSILARPPIMDKIAEYRESYM